MRTAAFLHAHAICTVLSGFVLFCFLSRFVETCSNDSTKHSLVCFLPIFDFTQLIIIFPLASSSSSSRPANAFLYLYAIAFMPSTLYHSFFFSFSSYTLSFPSWSPLGTGSARVKYISQNRNQIVYIQELVREVWKSVLNGRKYIVFNAFQN